MAETIYLNDGGMEVLVSGTSMREVLRRLISERIGSDAARAFAELISELEDSARLNEERADDAENSADGYLRLCRDAMDQFEFIKSILDKKTALNRQELKAAVLAGYNDLHKNL
jgi:hypothetical protein